MSASVWLEFDTEADEPARLDETGRNLTYNLSPMLRAAGFVGWQNLMGMTGEKAAPMLRNVVAELMSKPEQYEAMNPENGWGTYKDAITVLSAMAVDCARHPGARYGGWL